MRMFNSCVIISVFVLILCSKTISYNIFFYYIYNIVKLTIRIGITLYTFSLLELSLFQFVIRYVEIILMSFCCQNL